MKRAFGYRTEQRKRSENQDSFGVFPFDGHTLAIVCDGMGGHVGGAQASTLAVRTIHEVMSNVTSDYGNALRTALERANQAIYEAARKNHRLMGMGTTAVAAVVTDDGSVHIAHVGDSRAYLINEGQAVQITRDHTMVNLFVDAELLSPEDAATHPEAHVLSRSLGVERQVEVELSEPIELADNDVIFLCSDGVHGVVTDFELGSVDWQQPAPGIDHVLDIVDAREGDDNATAVAVLIGEGDSMPASPLPEPKEIEDSLSASALLGHLPSIPDDEDDYEPLSDPASYGTEPSAPGRDVAPTAPVPIEDADPAPQPTVTQQKDPTPKPIQRRRAEQSEDERRSLKGPLVAVALLGILAIGGAVVGVMVASSSGDAPTEQLAELTPDVEAPTPAPAPPDAVPTPTPAPEGEPVEPVAEPDPEHVLVLDVPKSPRRLPHRPRKFTQSPPGGAHMFRAVQAAREARCSESLDTVQEAMQVSPDHAKLYSQAWFCFDNSHAEAFDGAKLTDWDGLAELELHFRGWPLPGDPEIEWTAADKKLPSWYRPAVDGIEYRLEAWARSTRDDQLRDVMVDLEGEPTIADDLAHDVFVEASTAVALADIEDPTDAQVESWSRRVYVVSTALNGSVGRLLRTHRPELLPELERMLEEATTPAEGADLPKSVAKALEVGAGKGDPPTARVVRPRPQNTLPQEPDLGDGGSTMPGVIHR